MKKRLFITIFCFLNFLLLFHLGCFCASLNLDTLYTCPYCKSETKTLEEWIDCSEDQPTLEILQNKTKRNLVSYICDTCSDKGHGTRPFADLLDSKTIGATDEDLDKMENTGKTNYENRNNNGNSDGVVTSLLKAFMSEVMGESFNNDDMGNLANSLSSLALNFENHEAISPFKNKIDNIKTFIRNLALSLLLVAFLIYGIKTYVLWTSNPEENPVEIVIRFMFATALIMCFDGLYDYLLEFIANLMLNITNQFSEVNIDYSKFNSDFNGWSFLALFLNFALAFMFIAEFFKAIMNTIKVGISLMIMRIGFPLACLGIINPQAQTFNTYIQTIIKQFITIAIQVFVINLAISLFNSGYTSSSIATLLICVCLLDMTKDLGSLLNNIALSTGNSPGHIPSLSATLSTFNQGRSFISGFNKP